MAERKKGDHVSLVAAASATAKGVFGDVTVTLPDPQKAPDARRLACYVLARAKSARSSCLLSD
jgi:hypothetical protein